MVISLRTRLAAHIDDSGGPLACWPFTGARVNNYGVLQRGRRSQGLILAHVAVLEQALGRKLKPGMHALHTCDNPPCCNLAHLYEGTKKNNSRDMIERGRGRGQFKPGVVPKNTQLTADDIDNIRRAVAAGSTMAAEGRRFGVTRQAVYRRLRVDHP